MAGRTQTLSARGLSEMSDAFRVAWASASDSVIRHSDSLATEEVRDLSQRSMHRATENYHTNLWVFGEKNEWKLLNAQRRRPKYRFFCGAASTATSTALRNMHNQRSKWTTIVLLNATFPSLVVRRQCNQPMNRPTNSKQFRMLNKCFTFRSLRLNFFVFLFSLFISLFIHSAVVVAHSSMITII